MSNKKSEQTGKRSGWGAPLKIDPIPLPKRKAVEEYSEMYRTAIKKGQEYRKKQTGKFGGNTSPTRPAKRLLKAPSNS